MQNHFVRPARKSISTTIRTFRFKMLCHIYLSLYTSNPMPTIDTVIILHPPLFHSTMHEVLVFVEMKSEHASFHLPPPHPPDLMSAHNSAIQRHKPLNVIYYFNIR